MTEPEFDLHRPPFRVAATTEASSTSPALGDSSEGDEPGTSALVDFAVCPACGGRLVCIRAKSQCAECHRIVESCCEGGPE